jgi:hypothetical protein
MVNTVRRSLSLNKGVDAQVVLLAEKDGRSISSTAERLIEFALADRAGLVQVPVTEDA